MLIPCSFRLIFAFITLLLSFDGLAKESSQEEMIRKLQSTAVKLSLSTQDYWHGLMHYHTTAYIGGEKLSYVDDPAFFLHSEGKINSEGELLETIRGLFAESSLNDEHVMCRFPGRKDWLVEQLNIPNGVLPKPDCVEYVEWREQVNATRLSLIFPSAYINSPSSMFGHTFFRFDPEDLESRTDWLSWALSFGAQLDASDNSIAFAYRGIFGGYPGLFNMSRYFEKIKEYKHLENRDIWEYELNITPEEVDEILAHAWELKNMEFDYYFLDENCAFRLLEFIELVRPDVQLTKQFNMTAIPADTVRAVIDEGLVTSASFKPSATTELRSRIEALTDQEASLAREIADDISLLESEEYSALPELRKGMVTQVAFSFLRYQQLKIVRDPLVAQRSHQLLAEINRLPSSEHKVEIPERPEKGHKTTMIGISTGLNSDLAYGQFNWRATYHDLLDNPLGYPQGAHIAMGNTQLRYTETDKLSLQRFDFIDIVSMSEMDQFFKSHSWHVKTGYERVFAIDKQKVGAETGAYYVKAGGGAATRIHKSVLTYGFLDARLEHNRVYEPFLNTAFGVSAGALVYSPAGTLKLHAETEYFTNDEYRANVSLEQNFHLGINDAIRIGYSKEWQRDYDTYEVGVSYRHYY